MDNNNQLPDQDTIGLELKPEEGVMAERDALTLDIDDDQFIRVANKLIRESKSFFDKTYNLTKRRKENEKYYFGRQLDDIKLKSYNARYVDNIIWEGQAYLKPLALSRMPDIVVKPGNDDDESKQIAKDLSKAVSSDIASRERRRVLGLAFKHRPVYLIGAIKAYWNPELGEDGDYEFRVVHPENLVLDHTASSNDADDMGFVAEAIEYTVKEWVMRFPDKEQDFYKELRANGIFTADVNQKTEEGMNTRVKGWEIWFTWYDKVKGEYERIEGVGWFYKQLLFKKMKNPYWDWEGTEVTFSYDKPVSDQQLREAIMAQMGIPGENTQQFFFNHFDNPQKPYIFLGYDQWGKTPLDETSEIEQNIYKQQNVDKRGRQITEMLDRARGKHVFSTDSGLKKEDLEELDMSNPEEDLLVEQNVNEVHAFIPGEQPSAPMIQNLNDSRERIFDSMGVHAPVRGEVKTDVATTNQIAREADFTRADDLTDDTINYAAERMANWILQFIKLFYTNDHFVRLLGEDGNTVFAKINRDMVQDGMEVTISASGVDKLKAEQRAFDMAKLKLIDPLTFFQDINVSDPKGRTEKLMMFMMMPNDYMAKFIMGLQTAGQMGAALNGAPQQPGQGGGSPQALMDIAQIQQGVIPPVPSQLDPAYVQTLEQALPQLVQEHPELKEQILQFAQQVVQMAQQQPQQPQPQPAPAPGAAPQMPPTQQNAQAGPVAPQNPSPQQSGRVPITPPQRKVGAF